MVSRSICCYRHGFEIRITATWWGFATSLDPARRMGERRDIYGRRKDGAEFPAETSISRLELAGEITFTVILRNITARARFEQQLREQNLALERANLAKDRFLANMSHELRTPLNAIIGFTGTLQMRLPGPLTFDQEKQLSTIQSSAKHLLALINCRKLAVMLGGRITFQSEYGQGSTCTLLAEQPHIPADLDRQANLGAEIERN